MSKGAWRTTTQSRSEVPLVPRVQVASIFGVNARRIDKWANEEDLPVAERGKGGKASTYDVGACVRWYVNRERAAKGTDGTHQVSPHQERALLDQKRREEIELKLQVRRGELVEVAEVERRFADCANAVKSRLRRIPDAVADRVLAAGGPHAVKALLLVEIDAALGELAEKALAEGSEAGAA